MPRAIKARAKPTADEWLGCAMALNAYDAGYGKRPAAIVGKRHASKPATVMRIRDLAAQGKTLPEIAHIMKCSRTNIRRFRDDYGIKITNGESGPSFDGIVARRNAERLLKCLELVEAGKSTAEIAEALNVCKATARNYAKRCKDRASIVLR